MKLSFYFYVFLTLTHETEKKTVESSFPFSPLFSLFISMSFPAVIFIKSNVFISCFPSFFLACFLCFLLSGFYFLLISAIRRLWLLWWYETTIRWLLSSFPRPHLPLAMFLFFLSFAIFLLSSHWNVLTLLPLSTSSHPLALMANYFLPPHRTYSILLVYFLPLPVMM